MPCVSAAPADVDALLQLVTTNPQTVIEIDLSEMTLRAGDRSFAITLPAAARDGFLDGSWDATGLLLDRYEEVEAVANRLPYVNGFL
jgi:3-isopropylmalate/(R)-2-methylmalate dehydratase small subunit